MFHEPPLRRIEPLAARGDGTCFFSERLAKNHTRVPEENRLFRLSGVICILIAGLFSPPLSFSLWGVRNNLHYAAAATASLPNNPRKSERGEKQANGAIPAPAQMKGLGCWALECSHLILPAPLNGEQR